MLRLTAAGPGLVLALLLAGCAGPSGARAPAEEPAPGYGDPLPYPTRLELTGCTGWDGRSNPFPRATTSWPAPKGWEPKDPTVVGTSVLMAGYECQRIALGPFERGPIRLVYDGHHNVDVPAACRPSGNGLTGDLGVLNSVWVDDDEVALYLRDVVGLPARSAAITEQVQEAGAVRLRAWTWGEGGNASTLTVTDDGIADPDLRPARLFWSRGEGIVSLDLAYDRQGSVVVDRPAHGTMRPPMLLAGLPEGSALGMVRWYPPFPASGDFTRYADTLCTQPEA